MPGLLLTLRDWRKRLGDAVPLTMVPDILNVEAEQVTMAIRRNVISVHSFAVAGKVYRMVRMDDLRKFAYLRRKPLSMIDALMTKPRKTVDTPPPRPADEEPPIESDTAPITLPEELERAA